MLPFLHNTPWGLPWLISNTLNCYLPLLESLDLGTVIFFLHDRQAALLFKQYPVFLIVALL